MMKKLLIDIVMHPSRYYLSVGLPGQYDAAETLFNDYWDDLTEKVQNTIELILLKSGRYTIKRHPVA